MEGYAGFARGKNTLRFSNFVILLLVSEKSFKRNGTSLWLYEGDTHFILLGLRRLQPGQVPPGGGRGRR